MKRVFVFLLFMSTQALAAERIDYVDLGAKLLKDGYTERAKNVLEKADVTKPDFDFARYYSLKGILLHKLSYPSLSNIFINEAIKRGQKNSTLLIYQAKNYWLLRNYPQVVEALNKAGDAAKTRPQYFVIKAESYKQQHLLDSAWSTLDEGIAVFPDEPQFYRQKFYYLLELGFYQTALDYAKKYLHSKEYSDKDFLAVAYALRENHQLDAAAAMLEEAVIRYGDDDKLVELLGQVYIDQNKYVMAALVFDWASIKQPKFAYKAARLYLKAKQPIRSLQLNRRIVDQKEKFEQRLGIDIYLDDYESLVTKTAALKRYDLLKNDNITYALGYGYFQIGDYANAKKYLKKISDSQLFGKASHIFQQIETCQDVPYKCN